MQAQYDAKNPVALKSLIANGVKLHPSPRDLLRAANKAAFELYEAEAAKNPAFKKLYDPGRSSASSSRNSSASQNSLSSRWSVSGK